jgi:hypothetical protein
MGRPIIAILVFLLLAGAAAYWAANRPRSNVEVHGIYLVAFERSDFYPDTDRCPPTGKRWWLAPESSPELAADLTAIPRTATDSDGYLAVYIDVIGDVSGHGGYGHLGQYGHEVRPTKVVDVRKVAGCPW